jgi:hypothetical protein
MIILFGGRFTAGKTTACRYFVEHPEKFGNFKEVNFADKLKDVAVDLFGMTKKDRTLLQKLGTEALRSIDEDVWVKYIFNRTIPKLEEEFDERKMYNPKKYSEYLNFVIGDGRYENELAYGTKAGALNVFIDVNEAIRMERYKSIYGCYPTEEQMNHDSEKLEASKFDLTIENNDTIFEFQEELEELYKNIIKWQKKD